MWGFWIVLVVLVVTGILWAILRAVMSAPCEVCKEEGCLGNMYVKDVPYGPNGRITECLVCNICGATEPFVQPPLGP